MATPKKLSPAAQRAKELIDSRVEVVDAAEKAMASLRRLDERHAKERAAAEAEVANAVANVIDPEIGGWSVKQARDTFGLTISAEIRQELRRRKNAAKDSNSDDTDDQDAASERPALAVVPDPVDDDSGETED